MKRFITFLLLFSIICMQFSVTAGALVFPGINDNEPSDAPVVLCDSSTSANDVFYPYVKSLIVLEENEALTADILPNMSYIDTEGKEHSLTIDWNITDDALLSQGLHTVYGTPILGENYSLAEGFDGTVTWPLFRKGGDAIFTAVPIQNQLVGDPLIAESSTDPASEISISTKNRRCAVGEDGYILSGADWIWSWDYSQINTAITGKTTVTGRLTSLPSHITVPEKYKTVTHTVYVMPTDRIEIYAPVETMRSGQLVFEWLYDSANVTNTVLEQLDANDQWTKCDSSWYSYKTPTSFSSAKLYLELLTIPSNASYTFRLSYTDIVDSESVQRFSESVSITIPENIAEMISNSNGTVPDDLNIGGDRDGGDSGGNKLPDYVQPAPMPESNTNTAPSDSYVSQPVNEVITDTYSAISGLRLAELINAGDTVLFEKQGVSMEIPSELLKSLNIGYNELFEITILNPQKNTVQIEIIAAGTPVEDINGTIVYLPWNSSEGTDLECHDINGDFVTKPVYDTASKTARFDIHSPGTYFITSVHSESVPEAKDEPKTDEPKTDKPDTQIEPNEPKNHSALYIGIGIGAFVILLLTGYLIWRRWRHD